MILNVYIIIVGCLILPGIGGGVVWWFMQREPKEPTSKVDNNSWSHIEALPDAAFAHDGDKIIYANQDAVGLFGAKSRDDIIGRKLSSIVHQDSRNFVKEQINIVGATGGGLS